MTALSSLHVLLLDDNKHMRAITLAILVSAGIKHVHEASDGPTALDVLGRRPIDLAIVDFKMAPMDGIAFTRLVRRRSDNPYLPIIMLTGHANLERVQDARDAGVTEFMAKPIAARGLLERINALITRSRPFVVAEAFTGPCRRRGAKSAYDGPRRRTDDYVEIDG